VPRGEAASLAAEAVLAPMTPVNFMLAVFVVAGSFAASCCRTIFGFKMLAAEMPCGGMVSFYGFT
jgi:hypothetical protein